MKVKFRIAFLLALILIPAVAKAAGTAAGTTIVNQATADYDIDGAPATTQSNIVTIKVVELLNVNVTWQDASNIVVYPGAVKQVLTMKVTNTGNGNEAFVLLPNNVIPGDQFDPPFVNAYLDSNDNGIYDDGTDAVYTAGGNDPVLSADSSVLVFIVCDIPADRNDEDLGYAALTATAKTGSGVPGTVFAGLGDDGMDAVVGATTAKMTDTGAYMVRSVLVHIVKSATVVDPFGGSKAVPGATIKFTLDVSVIGVGVASDVVISDPMPTNVTYVPGSLKLNGTSLTDSADIDAGDIGATTTGYLTVSLGNMTNASQTQTISFDMLIN